MNKVISNPLPKEYDELFMENIRAFNNAAAKGEKYYCAFYPSFGSEGKKFEFIIYGQSIKGWKPWFKTTDQINDNDFLKESIAHSNSFYSDGKKDNHSPLDWVNFRWSRGAYKELCNTGNTYYNDQEWGDYFAFRSFFWNITYKLIARYYGLDENGRDWVKEIVWSNLYKIAPAERKNPSEEECTWQQGKSIELVKIEIEEIRPKYCIVLTNDDWWSPFREKLKTKEISDIKKGYEYIQSYEQYHGSNTRIIVTKRPFTGGKSNICVDEILETIKAK